MLILVTHTRDLLAVTKFVKFGATGESMWGRQAGHARLQPCTRSVNGTCLPNRHELMMNIGQFIEHMLIYTDFGLEQLIS